MKIVVSPERGRSFEKTLPIGATEWPVSQWVELPPTSGTGWHTVTAELVVGGTVRATPPTGFWMRDLEYLRSRMDALVTVGSGARLVADGAAAAGMPGRAVHVADDIPHALRLLTGCLREGDRVLCKASRRVGLDRLVDQLLAALAAGAGERAVEGSHGDLAMGAS